MLLGYCLESQSQLMKSSYADLQAVTVMVSANVMPRNKGTPGLKPSVHCLGFITETDTEAMSDWHGFD